MFTENDIKKIKLASNHTVGYFDYGQGKPVVMLHGFPDTAKTFCHQVKYFNALGYRVICPYLPGYEYSSAPKDGIFALYTIAKIISEFLDEVIPNEQTVIIGHDWGASILRLLQKFHRNKETDYQLNALIYAAVPLSKKTQALINHQHFPGFVQLYQSRYVIYFHWHKAVENIRKNNLNYIKKIWQSWSPGTSNQDPQLLDVLQLLARNNNLENAINYYRFNANLLPKYMKQVPRELRLHNQLDTIVEKIPALTLRGVNDGCLVKNLFEGCNDFFHHPATQFVEISKAGHFVHYDNPIEFNEKVFNFFKAISF